MGCIACTEMLAHPCRWRLPWGESLNTGSFEITKGGDKLQRALQNCNAGLRWPALWSFSSLLVDSLMVKFMSPSLQLDNILVMMVHLLSSLLVASVPDVEKG